MKTDVNNNIIFMTIITALTLPRANGVDSQVEYQAFLSKFGKVYSDRRFGCFQTNFLDFERRKSNCSFELEMNKFADLCEEDISDFFRFSPFFLAPESKEKTVVQPPAISLGDSRFTKELNWATSMNPREKSVVPSVQNQGGCGACWAFVAASTITSSAALRSDVKMELSTQQLIDCDLKDNGCLGGNYFNAYQYVLTNGITSALEYPFVMEQQDCRADEVESRVSFTDVIAVPRNDQMSMKTYLLQFGPMGVGVCGRDKEFLFYKSGVFNLATCCSDLNHAMTIVGYGTDIATGQDYWLAQNSWGVDWGEGGYMRILRTSEMSEGLCGLASMPGIPHGGYLTRGEMSVWEITMKELQANWRSLIGWALLVGFLCATGAFLGYIVEYFMILYWPRERSQEYHRLRQVTPGELKLQKQRIQEQDEALALTQSDKEISPLNQIRDVPRDRRSIGRRSLIVDYEPQIEMTCRYGAVDSADKQTS